MEKFSTSFHGYKKEDVNRFINDCINKVENMLNELKSKDAEIELLKRELEHYKNMESTFKDAIVAAEDSSAQIRRLAKDEYMRTIDEARRNASRIINDALEEASKTKEDNERLKRNIITFKRRFKMILEEQLDNIKELEHLDL